MAANWEKWSKIAWSIALLLLLAFLLGVIFLGNNAVSVQRQLIDARANLEEVRQSVANIERERAELERTAAQLSSQLDAFDAASRAMRQFVEQENQRLVGQESSLINLCRSAGNGQTPLAVTLCANLTNVVSANATVGFLVAQNDAVTERARGNFAGSFDKYGSAQIELEKVAKMFAGGEGDYQLQEMILIEGKAYSAFRLGNLDQARSTLDQAFALENTSNRAISGFVLSTDLKVRCTDGLVQEEAAQLHDDYRQRLAVARRNEEERLNRNGLLTDLHRKSWIEFREDDLAYFERDKELKLVCNL